ncbi:hypothetical protein [Lyngbya confervoides]|uniref:Uncharacterized protein n=1 Tax=Lyngbya confervoides BDU141951 TaxID=1574623 RepID=A0ABD4T617_9CYAN|nr:hypothetical protein [Lyngbya confervoides]MCM1984022.1 hypothetical protein [Lyngbya confervoides BDU141951]
MFSINRYAVPAFWLLLLLSFMTAVLSFPRWRSRLALFLIPVALVLSGGGTSYSYYGTLPAPDGQYALVVYSRILPLALPGQGSDAPAYVQLQDRAERVVGSTYVTMAQQVHSAEWAAEEVRFAEGSSIALP